MGMRRLKSLERVPVPALLTTSTQALVAFASPSHRDPDPIPLATCGAGVRDTAADGGPTVPSASTLAGGDPGRQVIISDHTFTDIDRIPDRWQERAKELPIRHAHASHGGQIKSGVTALEQLSPTYDVSICYAGPVTPTSMLCEPGPLCTYDGYPIHLPVVQGRRGPGGGR